MAHFSVEVSYPEYIHKRHYAHSFIIDKEAITPRKDFSGDLLKFAENVGYIDEIHKIVVLLHSIKNRIFFDLDDVEFNIKEISSWIAHKIWAHVYFECNIDDSLDWETNVVISINPDHKPESVLIRLSLVYYGDNDMGNFNLIKNIENQLKQ